MNNFLSINFLVLFGSLAALAVGVLCLQNKFLSRLLTKHATSFAAGVLLAISLLGLIPEAAHELGESAFLIVLVSFLATYIFENLVFALHHHSDDTHGHHTAAIPLVIVGDTIHNFIDGAAIAATYVVNPGLGITTAISTFLHEVPHEIADFGVLLAAGWKKRKIIMVNILSALTSFAGAYIVLMLAEMGNILGYLLAISGGIFLYLGASDFLPKPGKAGSSRPAVVALLVGIAAIFIALTLIPH